jgi:hypothetical protein
MSFKHYSLLIFFVLLLKPAYSEGVDDSIAKSNNQQLPNAFRDLGFGIEHAYEEGRNGIYFNVYSYHMTIDRHWPSPYVLGDNESTLGLGYSRTYFNPKYNSEYSLGVLGFFDTEYKPELHIGYTYFKYWNVTDSDKFKVGLGYAPFIFVKPSWTEDAPVPLPGISLLSALRFYDTVNFQVWYTGSLYFFNFRIDF